MTPNAITLLFKEARDAFPPIEGKPVDDDLLSIRETLLPILMEVPYDQLGGVHSLTSLITDDVRYTAERCTCVCLEPLGSRMNSGFDPVCGYRKEYHLGLSRGGVTELLYPFS